MKLYGYKMNISCNFIFNISLNRTKTEKEKKKIIELRFIRLYSISRSSLYTF